MNITEIVQKATTAANAAGDEWIKNATPKYAVYIDAPLFGSGGTFSGTLLDSCGNAHVQFKDARSSFYKKFVKAGLVRESGNKVVEIHHKFKSRQEYGLALTCAEAAKKILENNGISGLVIWQYID